MSYTTYLAHHGIKGQKWGIRRFQNPDGTLTTRGKNRRSKHGRNTLDRLSKAKSSNLEKWGKSPEHNALYITGLSGSGKSTVATFLQKNNNADYINLDSYFSTDKLMSKAVKNKLQSKGLNAYLDKNLPGWDKNMLDKDGYPVYPIVDEFGECLKKYAKSMYGKRPVVVEGVELIDETLYPDKKKELKGEPMIVLQTSVEESHQRGNERDGIVDEEYQASRLAMLNNWVKQLAELEVAVETTDRSKWIVDYISNNF